MGARPRSELRRYSRELLASRFSFMLPTQNRPCGSARPSLKRWCEGSYGAGAILRSRVPWPSTNQMPSRSAATNPPMARTAKDPMACGIDHAVLVPRLGSKRLSEGALMSTQYSTCSLGDQIGHSPRLALTSSTQVKRDSISVTPLAGLHQGSATPRCSSYKKRRRRARARGSPYRDLGWRG